MRRLTPGLSMSVSLGMTAAQVIADFAPVPYLGPAVDLLVGIIAVCASVGYHRYVVCQLRDRCHLMIRTLRDSGMPYKVQDRDAFSDAQLTLAKVKADLERMAAMNRFECMTRQSEIGLTLKKLHESISDCMSRYQIEMSQDMLQWQAVLAENQRRDHDEIISYLGEIANGTNISNDLNRQNSRMLQSLMSMMQNAIGGNDGFNHDEIVEFGLQSNLYQIQKDSETLLPDFHLNRGEVRKVSQHAVATSSTGLDIYEGIYLNREKVAIKVLRGVTCNEKSLRRFDREVNVWTKVWNVDRGKHILPFYGFCQNDGPFPYMVSPWQRNGNALSFVKRVPGVDVVSMIIGIAKGIEVLHSMDPPVVHGDIRGCNIMIGDLGQPLLSDFSVSRIVEDIAGVPFTKSSGTGDSFRWTAPELCVDDGMVTTASDIYAFSMTILELLTQDKPWAQIKRGTEAVIRCSMGKRPSRPTSPDVTQRGLNDAMWGIITKAWSQELRDRPSIQEMFEMLQDT